MAKTKKPTLKSQAVDWIRSCGREFTLREVGAVYAAAGGKPDWLTIAKIVSRIPGTKRIKQGIRGGNWGPDSVWTHSLEVEAQSLREQAEREARWQRAQRSVFDFLGNPVGTVDDLRKK